MPTEVIGMGCGVSRKPGVCFHRAKLIWCNFYDVLHHTHGVFSEWKQPPCWLMWQICQTFSHTHSCCSSVKKWNHFQQYLVPNTLFRLQGYCSSRSPLDLVKISLLYPFESLTQSVHKNILIVKSLKIKFHLSVVWIHHFSIRMTNSYWCNLHKD